MSQPEVKQLQTLDDIVQTREEVYNKAEKKRGPVWNPVHVQWNFLTKLYASVPANPDVVRAWLESRMPSVRPADAKSIDEINQEVLETLQEPEKAPPTLHVFQRHEGRLVVRAATIRAHIKDCARVLSAQYIGRIDKERAFSTRVINGVYPDPKQYWVPILRTDGSPIDAHDGREDKMVHARQRGGGSIDALKTLEFIEDARLDFTLLILGKSLHIADLETVMTYGGVHGYGGERSMDGGKYTFNLHSGEGAS